MNRAFFALPLIALVAVPTLVATLDGMSDSAFREHTVARDSARAHVRAVAARLDERIAALRNVLGLLQTTEVTRRVVRGESCGDAMTRAAEGLQGVGSLLVLDRTGRVQCASDPAVAGRLARGDNALRSVLRGKADWAITSGVPLPPTATTDAFGVAVPLRDDAGNAVGALVAVTPSGSLLAAAGDASGATAWLVQEGGELIGQSIGDSTERAATQTLAELRSFFVGRLANEVDTLGADGVRRVFGILPGAGHEHGITVAVGIPVAGPGERSGAGRVTLVTLIVSTLLAGAIAWSFRGHAAEARSVAGKLIEDTEDASGAAQTPGVARDGDAATTAAAADHRPLPAGTSAAKSGNPVG